MSEALPVSQRSDAPGWRPRLGLVLFVLALVSPFLTLLVIAVLTSWLEPLIAPHVPAMEARRILIGALADGLVLVGLFVLGGLFRDKVGALFRHRAKVEFGFRASPAFT